MMLLDSTVCVASFMYIKKGLKFIETAKNDDIVRYPDLVIREHFTDHLQAVVVGLVGGCLSLVFSIVHFIAQNLFFMDEEELIFIEYGTEIGIVLVFVSGIMFMSHMIKEETPGHPFCVKN